MNWTNYDDVVEQMRSIGLVVDALVVGKMQRVKVEGDREKRGWYSLHELRMDSGDTLLVGSFGIWRGAESNPQKIDLRRREISAEQRAALKARIAEDRKRADAVQKHKAERAAARAQAVWRKCDPVGASPYLERKSIKAFGVRFSPSGAMAIPLMDVQGRIHGLQVIRPKKENGRDKDFWPAGLAKKGNFFPLGGVPASVGLIAEGYATAASLHEATGLPTIVAYDAGNLLPVALALHKRYRTVRWLICADDDYLTDGNPGVTHASAAAVAIDGAWVVPKFADDRAGEKITDFNDLHLREGLQAVRTQIEARLSALGWRVAAARAEQPAKGGAGRRDAQSVMSVDEIVERFIPIDDGTGKYVFDTWRNRIAQRDQMFALMPAGTRSDDIKRHPIYIERGAYFLDEVGFDPSGNDPAVKCNTWRGWPMKPNRGNCDRLLELVEYLCSGDANSSAVRDWLLKWMAYPLQHPGAKMSAAVVMHGPQGTGKSTVFQTLAKIYGDYATVLNQRGLEDKFNSDWSDSKLFILAEEVVTRAEMWHIKNELKELVTGEWIRVNPKNIAAYRQRNQVNIAFLSNENQPIPIENDDRRHLVIYTPPAFSEDFYDELFLELEEGGVAAFYDYLLHLDLDGFHPKKRPPMTEAKRELILLSSPSELRFAQEWITGQIGLPVLPCYSTDFYAAYLRWCRANGEARPRPSNHFFGAVKRLDGWAKKDARVFASPTAADTAVRAMVFPPTAAVAAAGNEQKPTEKAARYLTDCGDRFADAIKDAAGVRWGT